MFDQAAPVCVSLACLTAPLLAAGRGVGSAYLIYPSLGLIPLVQVVTGDPGISNRDFSMFNLSFAHI